MKRLPEMGDVVRVGKGKKDQLVILAQDATSVDYTRRESYPGFLFVTIPYEIGDTVDPKERAYLISGCMSAGESETKVELNDITFVCKAKFKETLTRTFTVKE